ncbi:MAG: hypothetical protein WC692_10020 [Erythrobacter sp.]|jgi:hypothetical protein
MRFKSRLNPVGGITDFLAYFRQPTPHRWPILFVSCLMTFGLLFWITKESVFVPPEPPRVVYISTFAAGRSDEEIRESNLENQKRKEAREAELAALREKKVDAYKALGRATGLDVDTMAQQAQAENARETAAQAARQKELYQAGSGVGDRPE